MKLVHWLSIFMFLCAMAIMAAPPAHAFGLTGFGGKIGYLRAEDLGGTMALSGHLEFEKHGSHLHLQPSVMYWKDDDLSDVSANADLYYHFHSEGYVSPYLGAGLGINFFNNDRFNSSSTDLGANVFGGLRFPGPGAHYFFMEGRMTASDVSQFSILGGMTFHR